MKSAFFGLTLGVAALVAAASAHAEISISIGIAPPALPIYAQPPIPGDGYMWTPGYWSWDGENNDYYWVPGTWVIAPFIGALWTPGYWGWGDGNYAWHGGYWGSHIGYYGGINYGFGYGGVGYQGGYWNNGAFSYNRNVNNVGGGRIAHVYNATVNNRSANRISYNGGNGGVRLQPTRAEQGIAAIPHNGPTAPQAQHELTARTNPVLRASVNHGMPKVAATPEPGAFNAPNVSAAREARPQSFNRQNYASSQRMQAAPQPRGPTNVQPVERAGPSPQQMGNSRPQGNMHEQPQRNAERPAAPHEEQHHDK